MITALKSEFRKLLTVRSTYILTGFVILLVTFVAFYPEGWRLQGAQLRDPMTLTNDVTGALNVLVFGAVIAMLLMTHEYRYTTIMYTLTSSRSRSRVLWAKLVAVSVYALLLTSAIAVLSPLMSYWGVHASGHALAPQTIDYGSIVWRALFYGWAYITAALILAALIRNQIGAIVSLFVIPTVEQLLSLLFKHASVYLPFIALNAVTQQPSPEQGTISHDRAAVVFGIYLIVGWLVAWILFLRRDAN
jgi:ABC-2 type transport system permease protein